MVKLNLQIAFMKGKFKKSYIAYANKFAQDFFSNACRKLVENLRTTCKSEEELHDWLKNKWMVLAYNKRIFD